MMIKTAVSPQRKYLIWMLLALLTAISLRLFALSTVPPGLTHDEADHGITAWSIVEGSRALYFTIGYGREPLYDYATALLMAGLGPTVLAGRLTAVFFSLILISGMAAWVRRAFDWQTAVLTASFLAVSFWPLMTARQMLRSETLPALFVLAVYGFWRGLEQADQQPAAAKTWLYFLGGGLLLGLTIYTYLPARILWLIFPATLLYLAWQKRPPQPGSGQTLFSKMWQQTLLMLGVALLTAAPLLIYLLNNPAAESRIGQLSQPLTAAAAGDFSLLGQHIQEGLAIIAFSGDSYWRYNIAGQPLLSSLLALLFLGGLLLAGWWLVRGRRQSNNRAVASFLAVSWLFLGLSPVLVTGARLSTTQAIGMQPALYLFPALALRQGMVWLNARNKHGARWAWAATLLILGGTAVLTANRYFSLWANQPEVRVEYETTLVTALTYLKENGGDQTAVSTITPHPVHSPAVAAMILPPGSQNLRWFDGRSSLLLPAGESSQIIFPSFASLNTALLPYFETAGSAITIPLRPSDQDSPLLSYQVDGRQMRQQWAAQFTGSQPVQFGENALFLGYDLHTPAVKPGDVASLATWWQAERPFADGVIFTQLLGVDGRPLAQADLLSAPSALWQAGDQFIQLHQFTLPVDMAAGQYPLIIGLYRCPESCPQALPPQRLPVQTHPSTDFLTLTTLTVTENE